MNKISAHYPDPALLGLEIFGSDEKEVAESVLKSLLDHGCALIRRHVDSVVIDNMFSAARDLFYRRDQMAKAGQLPEELEVRHTEKGIADLESLPGGVDLVMASVLKIMVLPVASKILGHEPRLSGQDFIRRISPGPEAWHLPYHQDESVLNRPLINAWLPLHDCDQRHPRIEVIVSGSKSLIPPSPQKAARFAAGRAELDPLKIKEAHPDGTPWSPNLNNGDVMMFLGSTIHRTFIGRATTEPRYSMELRLV